jgi:hypothetical protein
MYLPTYLPCPSKVRSPSTKCDGNERALFASLVRYGRESHETAGNDTIGPGRSGHRRQDRYLVCFLPLTAAERSVLCSLFSVLRHKALRRQMMYECRCPRRAPRVARVVLRSGKVKGKGKRQRKRQGMKVPSNILIVVLMVGDGENRWNIGLSYDTFAYSAQQQQSAYASCLQVGVGQKQEQKRIAGQINIWLVWYADCPSSPSWAG